MDYAIKSDRGRVYQCTICPFKGERKAAVKHFMSKHFQVEDHIYRCTLCGFHSSDVQMFKRHPNFFKLHSTQKDLRTASGSFTCDDDYFITNPNPRQVDPDKDLKRWDAEESNAYWQARRKPSSFTVPTVTPLNALLVNVATTSSPCTTVSAGLPSTTCANTTVSYSSASAGLTCPTPTSSLSITLPSTISPLSDDFTPLNSDNRIVLDNNLVDDIISWTGTSPSLLDLPEPLRSPPCTVPKPVLPDISLPPPAQEAVEDQNSTTSSSISNLLETLISAVNRNTDVLNDIKSELTKNRDQMEKIEIAVRRGYTHQTRPVPRIPPSPRNRFYRPFNQSARKRGYVPEGSISP